jgi:hypothetical protein
MGHFPRPRFPGQSPGLLPDPGPNAYNDPRHMQYPHVQYPDMMQSGKQLVVIRTYTCTL